MFLPHQPFKCFALYPTSASWSSFHIQERLRYFIFLSLWRQVSEQAWPAIPHWRCSLQYLLHQHQAPLSPAALPSETQGSEKICPCIMSPAQASSSRPYVDKVKEGVGKALTSGSKLPRRSFGKGEDSRLRWTTSVSYTFTFQMNHDVGLSYPRLLKLAFVKLLPIIQMSNLTAF